MEVQNTKQQDQKAFTKKLLFVFTACFIYWIYLFFNAQMVARFDALNYERTGQIIYETGWLGYFKTGPHREPFYPFLISISMRLAEQFSISYHYFQKIFQILILFISQILVLNLLKKLQIRDSIKLLTILYMGFSPALVNAAFSLYSEILAIPFVLAIVYFGSSAWRAILGGSIKSTVFLGIGTAISFAGALFVKGIFEYIFIIFLLPYVFLGIYAFFKKNKKTCGKSILYIAVVAIIINACVISFKSANKKYHGKFELTNRSAELLYGSAVKRTKKITWRIFGAHIASVPGANVCRKFFTEKECLYCEFLQVDDEKSSLVSLLEGVPVDEVNSKTHAFTRERFLQNPLQYAVLMGIESLRMPFWESTRIGFVNYPDWLHKLFTTGWFKDGIRFIVSLATLVSLVYFAFSMYGKRKYLFDPSKEAEEVQVCFFILFLLIVYTGLYALFAILTRFALPIAPLYLLCIAYCSQNLIFKSKK